MSHQAIKKPANSTQIADSKRQLRKRELRGRITESSMQLFREKGFSETTIDDICESADVARRTLYSYFPAKSDIIRALCHSLVIAETINGIELAIEKHPGMSTRLEFVFGRMANNMQEADPLQKQLIQQLASDQSNAAESNSQMLEELKSAFTQLFETASDVQGLSPTMSAELSAEILISIISALSVNWISDEAYPLVENIKEIEKYLLVNLAKTNAR